MHGSATLVTRRDLAQKRKARRRRLLSMILAPVIAVGGLAAGVWGASMATAAPIAPPVASLTVQSTGGAYGDADDKPFILAGEDATLNVSLRNVADADGFNTSFTLLVPEGVEYQSSGMGAPQIYAAGEELPNSARQPGELVTVPEGFSLWVFEDVADLPQGAEYASTIVVRPDAALYPVGAEIPFALEGFVSSDEALWPVFDGSRGIGGAAAEENTSSGTDSASVDVRALRLTKSEPSPEIELLRGVHDNQTVYTLTVENTPQGGTGDVIIVDYLPAGLEFLGCADVDNTRDSALLHDGDREYPGAGALTGNDPGDCIAPTSVETVNSQLPDGLEPGVYTKVTWNLGTALTGGDEQSHPASAGTPGVTTIRYAVAVPLFENTMDFLEGDSEEYEPNATGEQAANLNNNNGPSTRQGQGEGFGDGILYTNAATVSGQYEGTLAPGTSAEVSDSDTERIQAMDLRILKSVVTGGGDDNVFHTGELATFTLNIATSEYTSADQLTITDTFPNGLCPVFPEAVDQSGAGFPEGCDSPVAGAVLEGATVDGVVYNSATGEFTLTMTPDPNAVAEGGTIEIRYSALMRPSYDSNGNWTGSTSSGDTLVNVVELEGFTHSIDALDGVENADGVPAYGAEDVWDDSDAEITSGFSAIQKRVLERTAVTTGSPDTAAHRCDVAPGDSGWHDTLTEDGTTPFHLGDRVCFELRVDFANTIDVRNPIITDFLPAGLRYLDSAVASASTDGVFDAVPVTTNGQRIDWRPGAVVDGIRFVPLGSTLVLHVLAEVTAMTANDAVALDKPENLMKYRQHNVHGDVFFERDAAGIQTGQGPTLLKGVQEVDGEVSRTAQSQNAADGTEFNSNRDGIQVREGEEVTYRIDLTGGSTDAVDLHVWDALPVGITAADVAAISHGGTALDPGDPGYPADLAASHANRSVIVWDGIALDAEEALTLDYEVTVPEGVLVNTQLPNTASITQFDVVLNTGDARTFYPEDSLDVTSRDDADRVSGVGTRDDSMVHTPDPTVAKRLLSTEIGPDTAPNPPGGDHDLDPLNPDNVAVQGELITYEYSVTIPAGTSVQNAVLQDRGTLTPGSIAFAVTGGSWTFSALTGAVEDDFVFVETPTAGAARGILTFPELYTNSSDEPQVFTVTLTGYLPDAGNDGTTLTNQAQFRSESWNGDETAQVVYREPNLQIAKSADTDEPVAAGDEVEYTLTITNPDRVKSYDNVVVDTVPAGLIVDTTQAGLDGAGFLDGEGNDTSAGLAAGTGGVITWHYAQFPDLAEIPAPATLGYTVTIADTVGAGETFTNTATVTGHTLPEDIDGDDTGDRRGDREATTEETITAVTADIDKQVRTLPDGGFAGAATSPIGYEVEYRVQLTLNPNVHYYSPAIADDMPPGAELVEGSISGPSLAADPLPQNWILTHDDASNTWTWTYDGSIAASDTERTLALTYRVLLSNEVAPNVNDLDNTASFHWRSTPDGEVETITDEAEVDVLNPELAISKSVSEERVNPGEVFRYEVEVTNRGDAPAYHSVIVDEVPAGIVVLPGSITGGGVLDGADPTAGGGTITWTVADVLHPLGADEEPRALAFSYDATLTESAQLAADDEFTNTVSVAHYESHPDEGTGREYDPEDVADEATTAPLFPHVTLEKTVSDGDIAYEGQGFGWTLTLMNTGEGVAQTIEVSDVLPKNWSYDAGSAEVRIGTEDPDAIDPVVTVEDDVETLVWQLGEAAPAESLLEGTASGASAADRTIVITFTATPGGAALEDAGVGSDVEHTNTLRAVTTDPSGAEGNDDGPYTEPEDTADAFIHAADLQVMKTPGAGLHAGGAAGVAWTIAVTNNGEDTAIGPFEVVDVWGDEGELPEGFGITGISGDGWQCTPVADAETGFTCARTDAGETLEAGESFPVITVTAQAAANFDVERHSPVPNAVSVTSGTHDPDPTNNEDDAEVPVTASADLSIVKTGPSSTPNAGEALNWTLTVGNDGPSDSVSVDGDLVTVSDTIPAGVENVTLVGTLPAGWSVNTDDPLGAGDTIEFTLDAGARFAANTSVVFTLSGTIVSGHPANTPITNEATVDPGPTEDPDEENNTSTTTTTPTIDTTLAIAKTRQLPSGDGWRDATSEDPATPGETVSYLITVSNTGTADARGVTVEDEVESYLTFQDFDSVEGTWERTSSSAEAGDDQHFALDGDLAAGESASFRVTFLIDSAHEEDVENSVVARGENATNEPEDDDNSGASRSANLTIEKSHTPGAVAGESVAYSLLVTNLGPSYSSGPIEITDLLPEGFDYQAGTAELRVAGGGTEQIEPEIEGQTLTWTIGDADFRLADGATIEIDFVASIDASVIAGVHTNRADVDGPDDTDPGDNTDYEDTPVVTEAALWIVKSVEEGPYIAGTEVSYTLTVTNPGPSVARDVVVTDELPAGLTLVALSGEGWECDVTAGSCARETLPLGSFEIEVTALIDAAAPEDTELVNIAEVSASTPDPDDSDNRDTEEITTVAEADLRLIKTAVDAEGEEITSAVAGTTVRYRFAVENLGPSDAVGPLVIADTLPEGFTFVGVAEGGATWSCESGAEPGALLCESAASLPAGEVRESLVILVAIDAGQAAGSSVNTATVSSETTDPHTPNNTDEAPLEVAQLVDLSIAKSHDESAVRIGDELSFALTVRNAGPSEASGVVVVDTLPAGLEFVSSEGSDEAWTVDAEREDDGTTTVTARLEGVVAPDAAAPALVIVTLVQPAAYSQVTNVAVASAEQPESDTENNRAEDEVAVPPMSTLSVTKEAVGVFQVGSDALYRLTVRNDGPTADPGPVTVTDELPAGLRFLEASAEGAVCEESSGTVVCEVTEPLAVGASVQIELRVAVGQAAFPEVANTVVVATPTEQTPDASPTDSITTPVETDPLATTGSTVPLSLLAGGVLLALVGFGLLAYRRRQRMLAD